MVAVAAVFGAILGSFINALAFRYNTGNSVLRGRSKCMRCGHTLSWPDLVPVFSYLFLSGRCRYCRTHISPQYPLVELVAGALVAGVYVLEPEPLQFALHTALWMTLLFLVVYDLRHQVLPWGALGVAAALSLASAWLGHQAGLLEMLAGPLLAAPLLFFSLVSKGQWMGWGDGLLELSLGWLLGLTAGATALAVAFWSGAAVGIGLMLLNRAYTMRSEVPFAPFLVLGAGCAYFLHVNIFSALPALFF